MRQNSASSRDRQAGFFGLAVIVAIAAVGFAIWQQSTAFIDRDHENVPINFSAENPFPRRTKSPDLDGGTAWFNTSKPIVLKDLRGKVVLLDFWTYCCINCMHVLPDLKFLERKYVNKLVVIGVHSAKFDNEKVSQNIRQAILRYEIEHPVLNDQNMIVWRKMNVHSWPTLVLIDPEGYYCGYVSGEGHRDALDKVIAKLIEYHRANGTLDERPIRFDLERDKLKPTPLKYPGKVLADEAGNRLFISDSNHNRIVIASLQGELLDIVGTGAAGAQDGPFDKSTFFRPQGMTLVGQSLFVADTENHLIRTIDLEQKQVTSFAGTGAKGQFGERGGPLRATALNSPWDLTTVDGTLFIAMAGPHQIWSHRLGSNVIQTFAGSGREDVSDGTANQAAFAQPSGLASDGTFLYVADSEGSAIRRITLSQRRVVSTLAGTSNLPQGQSLFAFGDRDGTGKNARLQHPLGLAFHDGTLYVADTYNHKIKHIDVKRRNVTTWPDVKKLQEDLKPSGLSEPSGLSIAANRLYVADTNHHRICVVDLASGNVSEMQIVGLHAPQPHGLPRDDDASPEDSATSGLR